MGHSGIGILRYYLIAVILTLQLLLLTISAAKWTLTQLPLLHHPTATCLYPPDTNTLDCQWWYAS